MFIGLESWPRATEPDARRRFRGQLVRSVLGQPPLHFCCAQPLIRVDTHLPCRVFRRQAVPGRVLAWLLDGGHLNSSRRRTRPDLAGSRAMMKRWDT